MRARRGFTIIELLVVMAILGILASLGIPKLQGTRERAYVASMISDLRQMVTLQEAFFAENQDYAGGVWRAPERSGTGGRGRLSFVPSPGNTITLSRRTANRTVGWRAEVRNPNVTTRTTDVCGIYIGAASFAPNRRVTSPGTPACY